MSKQQMAALQQTIDKYGYAQEVWVADNGDDTFTIIDGEHRMRTLQAQGVRDIPCKVFKLESDTDLRVLRQVANKLRGEHDKEKDAQEYLEIQKAGMFEDLAAMLAQHENELLKVMDKDEDIGGAVDTVPFDEDDEGEEGESEKQHKCPQCGFEY